MVTKKYSVHDNFSFFDLSENSELEIVERAFKSFYRENHTYLGCNDFWGRITSLKRESISSIKIFTFKDFMGYKNGKKSYSMITHHQLYDFNNRMAGEYGILEGDFEKIYYFSFS